MKTTRRGIVAGGMVAMAATPAVAQQAPALSPAQLDAAIAPEGAVREIIPIWPHGPPGLANGLREEILERSTPPALRDRAVVHTTRPVLIVFRPERPSGAAILLTPGGSYRRVVLDKEGYESAERFNAAGITMFVLVYRLPGDGHASGPDAPLQDVQRAVRFIRARASQFHIDPARVGIMGFSAGGHVAGSLTLRFDANVYTPVDDADTQAAKPAFSMLFYPVITMEQHAHAESRTALLGASPSADAIRAYSLEHLARADAPPTFLTVASDDDVVPAQNTILLYEALRAARVPAELHAFETGGHGFGIRFTIGKPTAAWPDLALAWLGAHGLLSA